MTSVLTSPVPNGGDAPAGASQSDETQSLTSPRADKESKERRNSKRQATFSSSFMESLGTSPSTEPAKKKIKKVNGEVKRRRSNDDDILGGIYQTMNKATTIVTSVPSRSPTPPSVPETESPPERKPRIRFADEVGKDLVEIRHFEIEEGERINVNNLSPDEIRALEAHLEKRALSKSGFSTESPTKVEPTVSKTPSWMPSLNQSEFQWRFLPVIGAPTRKYGAKSLEKSVEEERQRSSMESLYMPTRICDRFEEPPLADTMMSSRHRVKNIPLDCSPITRPLEPKCGSPPPAVVDGTSRSPSPEHDAELAAVLASPSMTAQSPPVASPTVSSTPTSLFTTQTAGSTSTSCASDGGVPKPALSAKLASLLTNLKKTGILQGAPQDTAPPALPTAQVPMIAPQTPVAIATTSAVPIYTAQIPYYAQQPTPTFSQQAVQPVYAQHQASVPTYAQEFYPSGSISSAPATTSAHVYAQNHTVPFSQPAPQPVQPQKMPHFQHPSSSASEPAFVRQQPPIDPSEIVDRTPRNFGSGPRFQRSGPFNGPVLGGYQQCRMFGTKDGCRFGDRCRYAHGDQPPPAASYRGRPRAMDYGTSTAATTST